jgi:nucleoside phosphorylase
MATVMSKSHDDYTVGCICALPLEMAAVKVMLDEVHEDLPVLPHDHNAYALGRIGKHDVVIACLPIGEYGIASATTVATQLLSSFHSIRFGLMVGIGGGVPSRNADIRLGDIVVSKPTDTHGGVVQYDYDKALGGGNFQRTGMLNRPPQILLTALSKLQANHLLGENRIIDFLAEIEQKLPRQASNFARPAQQDCLYLANYNHIDTNSKTCDSCDMSMTVSRRSRTSNDPIIHYGLIASANRVVKDSQLRDKLAHGLGAYCVEMEAAGLMNNFPCIVIRGICDYADSHKSKEWQSYAAAVAAAYAKELLSVTSVSQTHQTPTAQDTLYCSLPMATTQSYWRWCQKCQGLNFFGNARCPAGGVHDHSQSGDYSLLESGDQGQRDWKRCRNCQVLSFTGGGVIGPCSQGGTHDMTGSGNYRLTLGDDTGPGQKDWNWCSKCQGLAWAGNTTPGKCQAGGVHDSQGSGQYTLSLDGSPSGGQDQWRWCCKCQMLAFDGHSICAAGGAHINTGSGNYSLTVNDKNAQGQDRWKCCNKCYGLTYAGNQSLGPCPRTGVHDHTGSGNYTLKVNAGILPATQNRWAWCNKCQVLWYTGGGAARCPQAPFGFHNADGSDDYAIIHDTNSP